MRLRRAVLPIHRWAGLTLGLIVAVSAATGAGMAFRPQLDPLVYPRLFTAGVCRQPLPMDRFVAAARRRHPTGIVDFVRVRTSPTSPILVRFTNKDTLYFDRCTGGEVASQNRYAGLFGVLEGIHRGQWAPNGGWAMGAGALGLVFVLAPVGVLVWWPRRPRRLADGFAYDRRLKGPAVLLGLHRAAGAWVVCILAVSAVTAIPNAYDGLKAAFLGLGATTPAVRPRQPPIAPGSVPLSMERAWRTVNRLAPSPRETTLRVPRGPSEPVEVYLIEADAPHPNARSYLWLDASSGRVLRSAPYRRAGWGFRLFYWMLSIHTGVVGGPVWPALLSLGALGALGLAVTGVASWLGRGLRSRT